MTRLSEILFVCSVSIHWLLSSAWNAKPKFVGNILNGLECNNVVLKLRQNQFNYDKLIEIRKCNFTVYASKYSLISLHE